MASQIVNGKKKSIADVQMGSKYASENGTCLDFSGNKIPKITEKDTKGYLGINRTSIILVCMIIVNGF